MQKTLLYEIRTILWNLVTQIQMAHPIKIRKPELIIIIKKQNVVIKKVFEKNKQTEFVLMTDK